MQYRKFYISVLFILIAGAADAQTSVIDSLRRNVYAAKNEEQKLSAYLALCEEYQSLNRDSLDIYAPAIREMAAKSKSQRHKSLAELAYANWYYRWGWSDSALVFIEPEFSKNPVTNAATRDIYFKLSRAKAAYYGSKSRFAEALEVLYKILPEAEKYKDSLTTGLVCNTIGSITIARQQPAAAISWINRAILIAGNKSDRFAQLLAPSFVNAGYAYALMGKMDSAEYFINKALPFCRQVQNLNYIATALRIQTIIYSNTNRFDEAEKAMLEMIDVRAKTAPASFIVEDNLQLADFYANAGQLDKAIKVCLDNLVKGDITKAGESPNPVISNDPKVRVTFLEALAGYYKKAGRSDDYQASLEELVEAKDSLYAANSVEAIAELQTKYEVQRKENTILQQKYGLQRKNFLFYGSMAFTAILLVIAFALFRNYRKKQKIKVNLMMAEEKKYAEEAVKQAEEKERVRIASDLHDNLGAYAASMASNLSYIHLQDTDEGSKNAFKELSNNSNAIISQLNDTIWVLKKDTLTLTAISDRLKTFISRIQKSYPDIYIEVNEKISVDYALPSSQAFHLYRILQEAVNNSLKHSKGNNINITIFASDGWTAEVEDDGVGITKEVESSDGGNGLQNMKDRCREAGWEISWEQKQDRGTTVKIKSAAN